MKDWRRITDEFSPLAVLHTSYVSFFGLCCTETFTEPALEPSRLTVGLAGEVEMVTVAVGCEAAIDGGLLDTGDGGVGAGLFFRVRVIGFGLSD